LGKLSEAELQLRLGSKYAPENASLIRGIGRIYRMEGRYAEAVKELQRAIQLQPLASAYNSLGLTYYYMHEYKRSVLAIEAAIELNGRTHLYWGNLGSSCAMSPEDREKSVPAFRKAIEYAEQVLKVTPTRYGAIADLAEYRARLGDKKEAWAEIQRLPESARGAVASRLILAQDLTGLRKEAIESVKKYFPNRQRLREVLDEPALASLHADQSFKELVARMPEGPQ
jgi:tetratricopeptide (TPR) repeat protein